VHETDISAAGVVSRQLRDSELPYSTPARLWPIVIEPTRGSYATNPEQLLSDVSEAMSRALLRRGAILLRGFRIDGPRGFERVVSAMQWARPMGGYFMAEPGRVLDAQTERVFHTNSYFKTGGGFSQLGSGFHSENYYSFDVPKFQAFWCGRPPMLGGETAICFMARAFASLRTATRDALTQLPVCCPRAWTLASVAARYDVRPSRLRDLARELGLELASTGQEEWLVLQKPTVVRHPCTGVPSLQVNLSRELPALTPLLGERFIPAYRRASWSMHRAAWHSSTMLRAFEAAESALGVLRAPREGVKAIVGRRKVRAASNQNGGEPFTHRARLADLVDAGVVTELADTVWNHCCVFTWRVGDILLLDNFQMLHAGMPGLGARELRVMLLNPTLVSTDAIHDGSLHERLAH
jgi:alpha-ketoglutarate-dependent taurine dioxygenase